MAGGCRLFSDLSATSLYDLMTAMSKRRGLSACMDPTYPCSLRSCHSGCTVHVKLVEVQEKLGNELRSHSFREVLTDS